MSVFQIILISVLSIAVLTLIYFVVASEFRHRVILKRNSVTARIISNYIHKNLEKYDINYNWWEEIGFTKVSIKSFDGLTLAARLIEKNTQNFAIIIHGYGMRAEDMQPYCKLFYNMDYSILAVNNRAHGDSEGKVISMGHFDKFDIENWVNYINSNYSNANIVIFGLSMGAATACLYSGINKASNVRAIISDCAYCNPFEVFNYVAIKSVIFAILPTMAVFNHYSKFRAGFSPKSVDVLKAVEKTICPLLLIHGDADKFVPFYMHEKIYSHVPKKLRQKLVVKNAGHAEGLRVGKQKYTNKIKKFLEDSVKN